MTRRALPVMWRAALLFAIVGVILGSSAYAAWGGSDSPTPYTVDAAGVTLPAGQAFPDNGHVNIRTDHGDVNLHFESKCITRSDAECAGDRHAAAQFIGTSFIPWSAFGLSCPFSVSWVQLSQFDEHFGEGGQAPVSCGVVPIPSPSPSLTTTPSPTPTETSPPSPTPTPSAGCVDCQIGEALASTGRPVPMRWPILAMALIDVGLLFFGIHLWRTRRVLPPPNV
jgi:hypothetical protein